MDICYSNEPFVWGGTVSCSFESQSFDLMKELLLEPYHYDLIIEDENGNSVSIPNVEMSTKVTFAGRIPRKMKKILKKKYGSEWVYHRVGATQTFSFEKKS